MWFVSYADSWAAKSQTRVVKADEDDWQSKQQVKHGERLEIKKSGLLQFKKRKAKDVGKNTEHLKKICTIERVHNKTWEGLRKMQEGASYPPIHLVFMLEQWHRILSWIPTLLPI